MNPSASNWQFRVSVWLCLAGIFSFTWRFGLIFNLKMCDILFLASAGFLFWSLREAEYKIRWDLETKKFIRSATLLMFGIIVGSAIGSAWSVFSVPNLLVYRFEILFEYARMLLTFAIFWLVFYLSRREKNFISKALVLAIVSPLPLWLSRLPFLHTLFFEGDERLRGPGGDPNYLGSWIAVALVVAAAAFLLRADRKGMFSGLATIFLFPLLLWTGSRGAVIAWFVSFVGVSIYYLFRNSPTKKISKLFTLWALPALGVLFAFVAAPPVLDQTIMFRFVRPYFHPALFAITKVPAVPLTSSVDAPPKVISNSVPSVPVTSLADRGGWDRFQILGHATRLFIRSPLGFGPHYQTWKPVALTALGSRLPAHEIFLEAALRAGWLGFFCLLGILWLVAKRLADALREDSWIYGGVLGAFLVMTVIGLSTDTLTLRWFWVIVAFAASIGYPRKEDSHVEL